MEQEIDLLKHQINEIDAAEIRVGEEEDLDRRYRLAANSSHLSAVASQISGHLGGEDGSVLSSLAEVTRLVRDLEKHDPAATEFTGGLDNALVELEELEGSVRDYVDGLELDPAALTALEARVDLFETLKRKYGNTLEDVLAFRDEAESKLNRIESRGDELERLADEIAAAASGLERSAKKLSVKRKRAAPKLAKAIAAQLGELGFKRAHFEIQLEGLGEPVPNGAEEADFMFSPNPGEPAGRQSAPRTRLP